MSTVADVRMSLNLITLSVDLHASVSSDSKGTGLSNFCQGIPCTEVHKHGENCKKAHDPLKINQIYRCPDRTCANEDKTTFVKGRKQGKGWVIVPPETVAEAVGLSEGFAKGMEFTYHPAAEVEAQTIPIDAPYYLALKGPMTGTPAELYALLAAWVAANPEIALLTRYAPRTSVSTFRLIARDGVLMLQKRCSPQDMHAPPAVPSVTDTRYAGQLDAMIRSQVEPYERDKWVDRRKEILNAYAAEHDAVITGTAEPVAMATMLDLGELLKRSTAKPKVARPRKKPVAKSA